MAQQTINAPASRYAGPVTRDATPETGDPWKDALDKVNANFTELYAFQESFGAFVDDFLGNGDGSIGISTPDYEGAGSYQPIWADLNVAAAGGSDDGTDPSFLAPIMGNVLGDVLTGEGNYLAGLIGAYSITGAKGTVYPAAGVMGIVMDGVTELDAAVLAVIDGSDPSAETRARAAFGVRMLNNHANSGVDYGLDLFDDAATTTEFYSDTGKPFATAKALVRSPHELCWIEGDGAPVDYTDGDPPGTGEGYAAKGSLYSDYTNAKLYINTGTKAQPAWTEMATVP